MTRLKTAARETMCWAEKISANDMCRSADFEFQNRRFLVYTVRLWSESGLARYHFASDNRVSILRTSLARAVCTKPSSNSNRKVAHEKRAVH